ncbi:MAG: hypothetical protein WDM86_15005 [Rhizomicrobium sp.]
MSVAATAVIVGLFLCALAAKFISDAAQNQRQKLLWLRGMQVAYLALLIVLGIKIGPLAWPYIEKMLSAQ